IENYLFDSPSHVLLRRDQNLYREIFRGAGKGVISELKAGQIIPVQAVEWTGYGTPWLKTPEGYISANRQNVAIPGVEEPHRKRKDIDEFLYKNVAKVVLKRNQSLYG